MKITQRPFILGYCLLMLALMPGRASAGTVQYRFDSGVCANGKIWSCVSCYIAGVFVWADGVDCDGKSYSRRGPCPGDYQVKQISEDPTAGLAPTHTGETEIGPWRSVIARDDAGVPIAVVGIGETGMFYTIECGTSGR